MKNCKCTPLVLTVLAVTMIIFYLAPWPVQATEMNCSLIHVFTGPVAGDKFAESVSGVGDVNGDGYADVIIGAPYSDIAGNDAGLAYIYSGQNGQLLYTFTGEAVGDLFGMHATGAGDVNNDGRVDFVVSALFNNDGRVYIFLGRSGPFPISINAADADIILTGETAGDWFGTSVSGAGDVNNDGLSDIVVGASENDLGGNNAGRVYVFLGTYGPFPMTINAGNADYIFTGDDDDGRFGYPVKKVGDIDKDGFDDIIVGEQGDDASGNNAGAAYVISPHTTDTLFVFYGENANDHFGISVCGTGDVNGDGFVDVIVGADLYTSSTGRAYVYSGQDGALMYTFTGENTGDRFAGPDLASELGDVDGDGYSDMLVGGYLSDVGGSNIGRAYIFRGGIGPFPINVLAADADYIFAGEASGDEFSFALSGAGDVDGDGIQDAIIGARLNDAGGADAGRAYVLSVADHDGDDIFSQCDNCPDVYNPDQIDSDGDTFGDVCDNCPNDYNPEQEDGDSDNIGDACDNCPTVPNADQVNSDADSYGDACDNCPEYANEDQADADDDNIGDLCDNCPNDYNLEQEDGDDDNIGDVCDNCPTVPNADQQNSDEDALGDLCDNCPDISNEDQADIDIDYVGDLCDNCPDTWNPTQGDSDSDGIGDVCQINDWRVEVETKDVYAGCPDVTVDFTFYWAADLNTIAVPLVVRELDAGSFWTPPLPYDSTNLLRLPANGVTWNWSNPGWADLMQAVRPVEGCETPENLYDGVSPDNFVIQAASLSNSTPAEPDGRVCVTLEFGVTEVEGRFVFDTACATTEITTIFMIEPDGTDHGPRGTGEVTFKPGVITIGPCDCTCFCDLNGDCAINPVDVVYIVNCVYKGQCEAIVEIPTCPGINGDWNCDGQRNPVDVVMYVNYVYKSIGDGPCNPCME